MSSSVLDITEHWRTDNELRRTECFIDYRDAAAHIRKMADEAMEDPEAEEAEEALREIHGLCKAIELDFFRLIGKKIHTNQTPDNKTTGPRPLMGKLVAVLSSGQGLVLTDTLQELRAVPGSGKKIPIRHGFIISFQKLSDFERKQRKGVKEKKR